MYEPNLSFVYFSASSLFAQVFSSGAENAFFVDVLEKFAVYLMQI